MFTIAVAVRFRHDTHIQEIPWLLIKEMKCPACESLRETVGDLLARVADLEMKLKGVEDKNTAS